MSVSILQSRLKASPKLVRRWTTMYDKVWIGGGAARWLWGRTDDPPRDWDLVVTCGNEWRSMSSFIHDKYEIKLLPLGGVHFSDENGIPFDLFFMPLELMFERPMCHTMLHVHTSAYWERQ